MKYGVIVDGYSSGCELVNVFRKLGIACLHVQSNTAIPDVYLKSFTAKNYVSNTIYNGKIKEVCKTLELYRPIFVIPGSEPGVELADLIANTLKISDCNTLETSEFKRNKFLMQEQLKKRNLPNIPQFKTNFLQEALTWAEQYISKGVILKPLKSAGGDKVKICYTKEEVTQAFNHVISAEPNLFGFIDQEVLIQKYIYSSEPEIAVNTVSCNGKHFLCELWQFYKKISNDGKKIYEYSDLALPNPYSPKLINYAFKVANALGIEYGPMHAEILLTTKTPVLIEAAARLMGANIPLNLMYECLDYPQILMTALAYTDPADFFLKMRNPIKLKKQLRIVFLISSVNGKFIKINHFDTIKNLSSFYDMKVRLKDKIFITNDYNTSPGLIYLCHENKNVLETDYLKIRQLEKTMYEVVEND